MARSIMAAVFLTVLAVGHVGFAQDSELQAEPANGATVARVTFTRNLWSASPGYYSAAISSVGNAVYRSTPSSDQRTGEPYMVEFLASDSTRSKIFQIVQQLNFLRGKFRIRQSSRAHTGTNTLTFADGPIENQITYTSTKDPLIQQLTILFENISATLEFGRKLECLRHGNASGLTAELKHMQRMSRQGRLVEFQAIAPVVQGIASDETLSNASRGYARAILKNSGTATSRASRPQHDYRG